MRWRWVAGLGGGAGGLSILIIKISHDRMMACQAWLDRAPFGSIAEEVARSCMSQSNTLIRVASAIAILSLCAMLIAFANLTGLAED